MGHRCCRLRFFPLRSVNPPVKAAFLQAAGSSQHQDSFCMHGCAHVCVCSVRIWGCLYIHLFSELVEKRWICAWLCWVKAGCSVALCLLRFPYFSLTLHNVLLLMWCVLFLPWMITSMTNSSIQFSSDVIEVLQLCLLLLLSVLYFKQDKINQQLCSSRFNVPLKLSWINGCRL